MSMRYCHYCERHIDIDYDVEHFDTEGDYECREEEENARAIVDTQNWLNKEREKGR